MFKICKRYPFISYINFLESFATFCEPPTPVVSSPLSPPPQCHGCGLRSHEANPHSLPSLLPSLLPSVLTLLPPILLRSLLPLLPPLLPHPHCGGTDGGWVRCSPISFIFRLQVFVFIYVLFVFVIIVFMFVCVYFVLAFREEANGRMIFSHDC